MFSGIFVNMSYTSNSISLLLLMFLGILNLGRSWIDEDINEQFYSQSALDATGQSIPMSSYTGKVMYMYEHHFCKVILSFNTEYLLSFLAKYRADYHVFLLFHFIDYSVCYFLFFYNFQILCKYLFCSLAVLDLRVGHTMDVLSPFIPVLCHSD